ncbi:ribonuclease HI family protein [Patescibacteria group bacterium]|nr:ribonuclease HI family protein [Patescibacteria group bacterium]
MQFTIFADGGARGNPGPAGAGAIVRDEKGMIIAEVSEFLGHTTNNVAEYTGILRALEKLLEYIGDQASETEVVVKMDSMLVVKQMKGEYRIKHPNLTPLAARVQELIRQFKSVSFAHVYREQNKEADALANAAMDRGS